MSNSVSLKKAPFIFSEKAIAVVTEAAEVNAEDVLPLLAVTSTPVPPDTVVLLTEVTSSCKAPGQVPV